MEKIIIWGAGNSGQCAYNYLKNRYEVLFFVDTGKANNNSFIESIDGKKVYAPDILRDYKKTKVVVASIFYREILNQLEVYGVEEIEVFNTELKQKLPNRVIKELDSRTIDLGEFFSKRKELSCRDLTFIAGGSGVLDYLFLREVARLIDCKVYLEIGTYIGESINILTDICDVLYSITAPLDSEYSGRCWCKTYNMPDYSERLTNNKKIQHFYCDSKTFDFNIIEQKADLYFIDGDHSYEGVYSDTKKVFETRDENSIVIWHDFKMALEYRTSVVKAVRDVLGSDFENVYVTDNNICGIYIPEYLKECFKIYEKKYEENRRLYTYDTALSLNIR